MDDSIITNSIDILSNDDYNCIIETKLKRAMSEQGCSFSPTLGFIGDKQILSMYNISNGLVVYIEGNIRYFFEGYYMSNKTNNIQVKKI